MKQCGLFLILGLAGLLLATGCGSDEAEPQATIPDSSEGSSQPPSSEPAVTPANTPPAPPPPSPRQATPPGQMEAQATLEQGVEQVLSKAAQAPPPKNRQERFERNMNWIIAIKDGNAQQRSQVIAQIRAARLNPEESKELTEQAKMYGLRL